MAKRDLSPSHPGKILLEKFMKPLDLSQYRLAKELGISAIRINQIIHGKRAITADTAIRLSCLLKMDAAFWLNLQSAYDLEVAMRESYPKIRQLIKPLDLGQNNKLSSRPRKRKAAPTAAHHIASRHAHRAKTSEELLDFNTLLKKLDHFALNFKVDKKIRK